MTTDNTGSESRVPAPCPFCGGEAQVIHIEEGENAGGSCVGCTRCLASSNIEFGRKENFLSNWNRRSPSSGEPSPRPVDFEDLLCRFGHVDWTAMRFATWLNANRRHTTVSLPSPTTGTSGREAELVARITEYLSVGGLFNPEILNVQQHEAVRDLLMDCRSALSHQK